MAKLTYTAITSLDGYIEDEGGGFDWAEPDADVFRFVNDLERPIGTYLYGRRMYEMMAVWQTIGVERPGNPETTEAAETAPSPEELDFAQVWRSADKIVYSRTLDAASTPRTRLEREFDPEAVHALKYTAERDLTIGGSDLARHAFAAGLVDEVHLFLHPLVVGGGKPALPRGVRVDLELLAERRFTGGVVYVRYSKR